MIHLSSPEGFIKPPSFSFQNSIPTPSRKGKSNDTISEQSFIGMLLLAVPYFELGV